MTIYDQRPNYHPRSPVQPGRSPAPLFLAVVAAMVVAAAAVHYRTAKIEARHAACASRVRLSAPPNPGQARTARGDLAGLIRSDDYPSDALDRNEQGTTRVRLDIDPEGWARDCAVVASSGSRSLDRASCRILSRRACFVPARNSSGAPIEGSYSQNVVWRIAG